MKNRDIEERARLMGVDLRQPHARAYIKACLESEDHRECRDTEPRDASGYTENFNVLVIGE